MSSTMLSQFRKQRRMRRFKVGLIRLLGNPIRWNQRVESLELFSHLCAVEHYHVEGEATPCANEIFEVAISDFPVFQSTDHIKWLYPIIYESTTSLKSQKIVYTTFLAEVAVLKVSVLLILFLSIKNIHSLMNVDRRQVVFHQEFYHCTLFQPHRHTRVALLHIYILKPSSWRSANSAPLCREV